MEHELDLSKYTHEDDLYDVRRVAQNDFERANPTPDRPKYEPISAGHAPTNVRHGKGWVWFEVADDASSNRFGSRSDLGSATAQLHITNGHTHQDVTISRAQLLILRQQISAALDAMDNIDDKRSAYLATMKEYDAEIKQRDDQRQVFVEAAEAAWREANHSDDDPDDHDGPEWMDEDYHDEDDD